MLELPDVTRLAAELVGPGADVAPEGAGWDHTAWRVVGADGVAWIVRAASGDDDAADDDLADEAAREVAVMGAARSVLGELVAGAVVLDEGVIAYVRRPGEPLQALLAAGRVPTAAATRLAGEIGGIIGVLAALEPPASVPVDDGGVGEWLAELPDHVAAIEHLLGAPERAAVERFVGTPAPSPATGDLPFCHNDLGAEHVLVDPATLAITGIIDWSDAARADPAAELGRLLRDLGAERLDAVLDGMAAADRPGLTARAWSFARCLVVEDLAYAVARRPDLVAFELASLRRLYAVVT